MSSSRCHLAHSQPVSQPPLRWRRFLRGGACLLLWAALAVGGIGRVVAGDEPVPPKPPTTPEAAKALAHAEDLDAQVDALFEQGKYSEAVPLAREALEIYEKQLGPDHPSTGTSLVNLAQLLQEVGDYAGAKPLCVRALAISEKAYGPEHPETGTTLNNLAALLEAMGDYADAKPLYVRALAISERAFGPAHPSTGTILDNLALLLKEMGDYAGAKPLCARALAISEQANGPDHPATGVTLSNLAALLKAMGDYAGAKPLYERALAISEKVNGPEHPKTGSRLSSLASVLGAMGDHAGARPLYVRALAISEQANGPDHPQTGSILVNLAVLLHKEGDYAGAKPLYERALAIREKARGPDHPETGTSLNNLAVLLTDMGDYAGAKPLYVRALAISEKAEGPDHPATGRGLNNLGMLLQAMGDHAGAKPLYERALAISEKANGPDHPSTGTILVNLAMVLQELGDHAGAKPLCERALAISEQANGPDHPTTGTILNNLASLLQDMGDYVGAKPRFLRALGIAEAFVRRESIGAQSAERLALAKLLRWHLSTFLGASVELGSTGYPELLRFKGLVSRSDGLDRALARHPDPALHDRVESLVSVERRLSALANAVPSARDEAKSKAWQETYAGLSAEREEKTRALAHDFAPFREALEGKEPGLPEVQRGLAAHEVLVDLFVSGERYLAFVVGPTGEAARLDLGEATRIEQASVAFVQASQRAGVLLPGSRRGVILEGEAAESDTEAWEAAGKALRELAFAPVEARLPASTTTLYLVPDGALAAVPFALPPGKEPGKALIDAYRIVHLSMAQDLVAGKDAPPPGQGALLVGGVDYEKADPMDKAETPAGSAATPPAVLAMADRAPRGGKFTALAGTGEEVAGLRQRFGPAATVLLGSKSTEARLRAMVVGKRVVHFATHGFVRDDLMVGMRRGEEQAQRWMRDGMERHLAGGHDPMLLAALAMAGANPRDGADGDDGILTAAEASYMNLDACDLVVLSACETAKGTPESGEGVLGLVHGFELAGARSVVGSLWKVDDQATRLLMDKFYDGYLAKEKPLSPSEALREAAIWLRDSKPHGKDYSSPRYWAAFVCYEKR